MSSNFPVSLDELIDGAEGNALTDPDHVVVTNDANDAIEKIEAKIGINGSIDTNSLDYKIANHNHSLANLSEKSHTSLTDKGLNTHAEIDTHITNDKGYTIKVQALTSSPADGATIYFGMLPKAPTTSANISKVYIRKAGTIKIAEIYCYSGTAGTNESWSLYIRKNNSADTLIATLSVNTSERVFSNTGLSIAVVVGDYIEIKAINPTWVTNPLTCIFGGYIYIE